MNRRRLLVALAGVPLMGLSALAERPAARPPWARPSRGKRVLLTGLDPAVVDYRTLPDLNAEKLQGILDAQQRELGALGYQAQWCLIDTSATAELKVIGILEREHFDAVLIGAGVRLPPENFLLFERMVNAVHQFAPEARIIFNATANDTAASIQRWL